MIPLRYPSMNEAGTEKEQIRQLKNFLWQHIETLQRYLNDLETGTGQGQMSTEMSATQLFNMMKPMIIEAKDIANAYYQYMSTKFAQEYVSLSTHRSDINNLEQEIGEVTEQVGTVNEQVGAVTEQVETVAEQIGGMRCSTKNIQGTQMSIAVSGEKQTVLIFGMAGSTAVNGMLILDGMGNVNWTGDETVTFTLETPTNVVVVFPEEASDDIQVLSAKTVNIN